MTTQEYGIVLGIVGAITGAWSIVMAVILRMFWTSIQGQKESAQTKENCKTNVESIKELMETKFEFLAEETKEIKELIKNNGHSRPRVTT